MAIVLAYILNDPSSLVPSASELTAEQAFGGLKFNRKIGYADAALPECNSPIIESLDSRGLSTFQLEQPAAFDYHWPLRGRDLDTPAVLSSSTIARQSMASATGPGKAVGKVQEAGAESAGGSHIRTYTIEDVSSVTHRQVDPIPDAADDEYTLYTITLKDGAVHIVKVSGMMQRQWIENAFYATGYTGSVSELMAFR